MPWSKIKPEKNEPAFYQEETGNHRLIPYSEAIREALTQAMELDQRVFVMGQGVDDPIGMFGATLNLHKKFGKDRVFDTPLSENGLMGVAIGAAIGGMKPIYFHNRPDFLLLAMDQLINHAAKWSYMFGGKIKVPLVVWACIGRGWGSGPQHSQALQAMFMHVPGLKLVMPSTCYDAKGLMMEAIADKDPVLIIDHRYNFKHKGFVPEYPYRIPFKKGVLRKQGKDVSIVAISYMVTEACRAAEILSKEGIEAEVIDLRTLKPWDEQIVLSSVAKTGRLIIADPGWKTCGVTAEIVAKVAEEGFRFLKSPVRRIASPDVPTPTSYVLERAFYPGASEIIDAAREIFEKEEFLLWKKKRKFLLLDPIRLSEEVS